MTLAVGPNLTQIERGVPLIIACRYRCKVPEGDIMCDCDFVVATPEEVRRFGITVLSNGKPVEGSAWAKAYMDG